ncbi:hypothetical protein ACGFMK_35965 [Amycolatopsis sp. NPDC049252]|uniref:hypothetical protein n=1 Tax=Amycolatopsis sp. NPDC049252 TaxID=3363933 RepID=UPI00371DCB43
MRTRPELRDQQFHQCPQLVRHQPQRQPINHEQDHGSRSIDHHVRHALKLIKTYTAEDDPNHLLSRPNGYSSKTAFGDSRVKADDVEYLKEDAAERGGSVEVFTTEEAAKARMDFIQAVAKGLPAVGEYDYVKGGALVRESRFLTPDQA